jgi:hypothetical protein
MGKLVFLSILLVLVILFYVPYLYRMASLMVEPYVLSGDNVAVHVYHAPLVYHKPNHVIPRIVKQRRH